MSIDREIIETLVKRSDLVGLEKYVLALDKYQKEYLRFSDPSIVLLAIQVYLDPSETSNFDFQLDVVLFLMKAGFALFLPYGSVAIYLLELKEKSSYCEIIRQNWAAIKIQEAWKKYTVAK